MSRLLALDYGDVRIGVAISDPLGMTAQPYGIVKNTRSAIDEIIQVLKDKKISKLIVGCPKNQHGEDSKKALEIRHFIDQLLSVFSIEVEYVDERFSTVAVERHLVQMDLSRKKRRQVVDTQAAMFILQGVLDRAS